MLGYGMYATAWALIDLVATSRLELWADLLLMAFGLVLILAAAFVRVRLPGGLALAIAALSGLQGLALHNALHLYGMLVPLPLFAALLVLCAYLGGERKGS
jgi:hypothetical protein